MKICRGAFTPVTGTYSADLKALVGKCLSVNGTRRPTVNQILALPLIQSRIKTYLSATVQDREFAHTVLHKKNVFDSNAKG